MSAQEVLTGILVLNYHHSEDTVGCIQSLLAREPETTRVLWLENDANLTRESALEVLSRDPFPWMEVDPETGAAPPAGVVGVVFIPENRGYAGGNNVGLRLLSRWKVPYAWVMNNDAQLMEGCSRDLVKAAEEHPKVGAWGTFIRADKDHYYGGIVSMRDFGIKYVKDPTQFENPDTYVSGCSVFFRVDVAKSFGFIPEDYFLYYEDLAFSLELRRRGFTLGGLEMVVVNHRESLSTGHRSDLMEFYIRRNRWAFIDRYYPSHMGRQKWRTLYTLQKYFFRGHFNRIAIEFAAIHDYKAGRMGRTSRDFSTKPNPRLKS